jgi:competence protein ComEA
MSSSLNELIEKRQQQLRVRDRQMRWLWIALIALAVIALAITWLREDTTTAPVNVNTASIEKLCSLPEVGPEIAQRIIAARPFSQPDDLLKVKGIGPATLNQIKPRLRLTDD